MEGRKNLSGASPLVLRSRPPDRAVKRRQDERSANQRATVASWSERTGLPQSGTTPRRATRSGTPRKGRGWIGKPSTRSGGADAPGK